MDSEIRIFYSWQSDLPGAETRGLIQDSITSAVKMLRGTVEVEADRDTKNEYGSPDIVQTIFSKIDECDIFIADVSIINKYNSIGDSTEKQVKLSPNPNVMLELGYAASVVGWENVICIMNTDFGIEGELPFDLEHRRLTKYSLKNGTTKGDAKKFIKDVIVQTVENLLENGVRVKGHFSNLMVGSFVPGEKLLSKSLVPYFPIKRFEDKEKEVLVNKCKKLAREINQIHLATAESNSKVVLSREDGTSFLCNPQVFTEPQHVFIKDEEKSTVISFFEKIDDIDLCDDFFELGDLKVIPSFHIAGDGTKLQGSAEEKDKYEKINELCCSILDIEFNSCYVKTFNPYLLFPLAITNLSTLTDTDISVSIIIDTPGAKAICPSKKIIDDALKGAEGIIYEDGVIKKYLLMDESSEISYETDISYSIEDGLDQFKRYGVNGAHYDEDDYGRELSKYIASTEGTRDNEYLFNIQSLRPKERCWLGPMIMLERTAEEVVVLYKIRSNKSDGNLSGELHYKL